MHPIASGKIYCQHDDKYHSTVHTSISGDNKMDDPTCSTSKYRVVTHMITTLTTHSSCRIPPPCLSLFIRTFLFMIIFLFFVVVALLLLTDVRCCSIPRTARTK